MAEYLVSVENILLQTLGTLAPVNLRSIHSTSFIEHFGM